jgi:Ca2+-binding RTX toxin-like protein
VIRALGRPAGAASLPLLPLVLFIGAVFTATTIVPASKAGRSTQAITANSLRSAACSGLVLNGIFTGSGTFTDNGQPHLVLGSSGVDTIRGGAGDDCILGGGGNDSLRGDGGTDVCIGGLGVDTFNVTCETQIQ